MSVKDNLGKEDEQQIGLKRACLSSKINWDGRKKIFDTDSVMPQRTCNSESLDGSKELEYEKRILDIEMSNSDESKSLVNKHKKHMCHNELGNETFVPWKTITMLLKE